MDGNDAGQEPRLRLRGYLVGNGVTDAEFDGDALVPFAYGKSLIRHGLAQAARVADFSCVSACSQSSSSTATGPSCLLPAYSEELYEEAMASCGGSFWNASAGTACDDAIASVYQAVAGLNIYDVLEPCYHGHNPYTQADQLGAAVASHRRWPLLGGLHDGPVTGLVQLLGQLGHTPPCLDSRWAAGCWGWGPGLPGCLLML